MSSSIYNCWEATDARLKLVADKLQGKRKTYTIKHIRNITAILSVSATPGWARWTRIDSPVREQGIPSLLAFQQ